MRWRSLATVAFLLALLVGGLAGLYVCFARLPQLQQEQELATRTTEVAASMLAHETERLSTAAADWALWSGLATLLREGTPGFAESEFTPDVLSNLRIHAFLLRNHLGQVTCALQADDTGRWSALPPNQQLTWQPMLRRDGPERSGLIELDGPWLFSSQPVTLGEPGQERWGRLVFARRVDEGLALALSQVLHVPVTLAPLAESERLAPAVQRALLATRPQEPRGVRSPDGLWYGVLVLPDQDGRAVLAMQLALPRLAPVHRHLQQIAFVVLSGLAALIFAVLALMVLHRNMIARLPRLVEVVRQVRQKSNFEARVTLGGAPELVQLGSEINGLLDTAQHVHERLQGMNQDLEERVRERTAELEAARAAERASAEQDRIYRTLFDLLPTGIMMESEDGVILDVNPALCLSMGYERTQMVGQPVTILMPPPHRHEVGEHLARLKAGEVLIHEVVNQRRDGSPCHMKLRERAVVLDNGQRRIIVNAEDVTEQRRAEERIQLQTAALESAVNGIMIVDRQGLITWANRAFGRLTGYDPDEMVGQSPRLLKSGRHDRAFYEQMWATILRGEMWRGELVNRRKDGGLYLEEMTITPVLDARGEATHFVGIKQDITERHNLQQQLYQAQKMEGIGRLAGGIAHDFNNLLQAITGFCTLLLQQMSPDSPFRPDVLEIEKAAKRAAALTRQLLAFSRRQMMETRVVNLNGLVENLQKMLQRLLGEDVQLVTDLAPDLDEVRVDPGQIEQVLVNLAINARDAMPQGGRLTISTYSLVFLKEDTLLVPEARHGRFVCLALSDTGVGMSREVMDHIFEPFYSTKGAGKGTGLGLSVVYGIIRQHDGMVHVYSQEGEGTTFRIYLPVHGEPTPPGVAEETTLLPAHAPPSLHAGTRILLSEDEDGVRDFAVRALRSHGYQVRAVATAQDAIQTFTAEAGAFDLLFTDVVLPDHNGLELAENLLARKPGLKVLFTSGYMDDKSRWPAIRQRGFHFLQKPYPVQDLLRTIQEVLDEEARPLQPD